MGFIHNAIPDPGGNASRVGYKHGFRSGLEKSMANRLVSLGIDFEYETFKIPFLQPAKKRTYTPDFIIKSNGIIIETKGRFLTADRMKHLMIQEQYGDKYDIRFVFSNARAPIYKGSKTTNASWCDAHGFYWANKTIPMAWLKEKPRGKLQQSFK